MVASHTNTRYNRRSWRVSDASWESSRSKPRTLVPNTYIAVREVAQERQQLQNVQESRHEFCRQQEIVGFFQGQLIILYIYIYMSTLNLVRYLYVNKILLIKLDDTRTHIYTHRSTQIHRGLIIRLLFYFVVVIFILYDIACLR